MSDLQGMIEKLGYDKYAALQDVFNICVQSAVGVYPQTFTDMWTACMDYGAPSWDATSRSLDKKNLARPKEVALFIMRLMNAPTSSWRNKYIDELGMDVESAKKLPYEEMARRYANYKHWKDAPIMGWLRGAEGREEKMEKIRKQFDKSVKERIGRLDYEDLRDELDEAGSDEAKKAVLQVMKPMLERVSDGDLIRLQEGARDSTERKDILAEMKNRLTGMSDKELGDSIDGTPSAERKDLYAGEYARRQGTQDYYGRADANAEYKRLRTYEDIREDIALSDLYNDAKKRGDDDLRKAIDRVRRKIANQKKGLGVDDEDDAEMMGDIRSWRREVLEKAEQAESGR